MKTQIFAYKGIVGISAGDKILNDPEDPNTLGHIVDGENVEISQEAFDILVKMPKGHDDIGDIDVFKSGTQIIVGWLGGPKKIITPKHVTSSTWEPELLRPCIAEVPRDEGFRSFIDVHELADPAHH